jgi:hypothetical protein
MVRLRVQDVEISPINSNIVQRVQAGVSQLQELRVMAVHFRIHQLQTGFYRLVIVASGCTLQQTADVNVNCVVSCGCTVGTLTYNTSTCLLSWTNTCSGYLADLERFNGATWVFVSQTNPI